MIHSKLLVDSLAKKIEKVCHFERQREIFLFNKLVLNVINLSRYRFISMRRIQVRMMGTLRFAHPTC